MVRHFQKCNRTVEEVMQLGVPPIVAAYLAAEHENDARRLSLCFAEDGFVHDEGQYHRGRDAIRRWKEEADMKYRYVSEPLISVIDGYAVKVRARLTGDFPGSPLELDHVFTLAGDKILSLEVHP
jgi:hypothetical protein